MMVLLSKRENVVYLRLIVDAPFSYFVYFYFVLWRISEHKAPRRNGILYYPPACIRLRLLLFGSSLTSPVLLQIKQLSLEICDDPFEVKLRDNYELLEDEYHESVKRRQTLDLKIEEQRRIHGLLQARKVRQIQLQRAELV